MTLEQETLLRDKISIWRFQAGPTYVRDYNRRCADALEALFALTAPPPPQARAGEGVAEVLVKLDNLSCPLESGKSFKRCPKCYATADQNCGRWVHAIRALEEAVRASISSVPNPPEEGGGWRPKLGDPVQISATAPWSEDWHGVELFFAGVHMSASAFGVKLNVTLSTSWPPRCNGDLTDDFQMEHIEPRVPLQPKEGE